MFLMAQGLGLLASKAGGTDSIPVGELGTRNTVCSATKEKGIYKNDTDEPICRAGIKTEVEWICGYSGEERVGEIESSIDIYILPCVKQTASGKLLSGTGSSAGCSVTT